MNKSNQKAKLYLSSYQEMKRDVDRETERLGYWKARARTVSAVNLSNFGIRSAVHYAPVDRYLELAESCSKRAGELEAKRLELIDVINCLEDPTCRDLLKLRYIDGKRLYDIARKLHFSLQHTKRLHSKALGQVEVPKEET